MLGRVRSPNKKGLALAKTMFCEVYVYDSNLRPVTSTTVAIFAIDLRGVLLDRRPSTQFKASHWGATLRIQAQPPLPYCIYSHDFAAHYAPSSLGDLNPTVPGCLDVIMYPLGQPATGAPLPRTRQQIGNYIASLVQSQYWSPAEGLGIQNLVETVSRALTRPESSPDLQPVVHQWLEWLGKRRIHAALLTSGGLEMGMGR